MLKTWLAQQAYSLLLRLFTPAYVGRVWQRGRQEPSYRIAWPQRLGFYGPAYRRALAIAQAQVRAAKAPLLWVHAVSLGETLAAKPLIAALRDTWPGMRLVLTHSTATGREAGQALLQDGDVQTWLPYDTPGAVRRFLRLHQPFVGVLMETEIWPNLQREAVRHSVPMVLANARLSEKSLRQAVRFAPLLLPAAQGVSMALAQTQADAQRLRQAGVAHVEVCGNVKFDLTPAPALLAKGRAWAASSERPIVLAAVTREGEEAALLAAWVKALAGMQGTSSGVRPRLMIVPRHPQRFDEVAALVTQQGLSLSRRSTWGVEGPDAQALASDVWLGDSMGEMAAYYAAAQVALLGGSFEPLGGQNLIEAAACGCPLVMGPHTFNFAEAAQLSEAAGAALRVASLAEAVTLALELLTQERRLSMATQALHFAENHQGAARRMAQMISNRLVSPRC